MTRFFSARVFSSRKHCGGVVVDHGGGLGAGELAQHPLHHVVAVAAAAACEVVFERAGMACRHDQGVYRLIRQRRAAQVGMQYGAGEVEHPLQAGRVALRQMRRKMDRQAGFGVVDQCAIARGLAGRIEHAAHAGEHRFAAVFGDERGDRAPAEDAVDRGRTEMRGAMHDRQSLCSL